MRKARKLLSVVLALVLAGFHGCPPPWPPVRRPPRSPFWGHPICTATIWGFDYASVEETDNSGMARLYTYIQQVRQENPTPS